MPDNTLLSFYLSRSKFCFVLVECLLLLYNGMSIHCCLNHRLNFVSHTCSRSHSFSVFYSQLAPPTKLLLAATRKQKQTCFPTWDLAIKDKIVELIDMSVRRVSNVKKYLEHYVENELFQGKAVPSRTRRRYFPRKKEIANEISQIKRAKAIYTNRSRPPSPFDFKVKFAKTRR